MPVDLFGNESDWPAQQNTLEPNDPAYQPDLIDAAAEQIAFRSGRPKSQEKAELMAAAGPQTQL